MSGISYLFKYIIIGDSAVGKTCLLLQFTDKRFNTEHEVTIGVEFGARTVKIEGETVKLQVWDTAGMETFRSIARAYYRGSAAALLVFDVTSRTSFVNISHWLREARMNTSPQVTLVLVGNKVDLTEERQVTAEEAERFARENGLSYMEVSAKTGVNVENCFLETGMRLMEKVKQGAYDLTDIVIST